MPAAQVDSVAMLLAASAVAFVFALVVRRWPVLGLTAYIGVLMFIPTWAGVKVHFYISPTLAVGALVVVCLVSRGVGRLAIFDLAMTLLIGTVTLALVVGAISLASYVAVVGSWLVPYLTGRLIGTHVEAQWVRTVIAVGIIGVAVLAIAEFATGRNIFIETFNSGTGFSIWGTLQMRGGRIRVEGAFGHSIALGATLAMCVPFVWASRLHAWVKLAGIGLIAFAASLTFSRIGMVSTAFAFLLSLMLLRRYVSPRVGRWAVGLLVVATIAAAPTVRSVFSAAGQEASASALYRGSLTSLLPAMSVFGQSGDYFRTTSGAGGFGSFDSIDSAAILIGLSFGFAVLAYLLVWAAVAAVGAFRRRSPELVSAVSIFPALTSVAFITQFTDFFWFVVGLAVAEWASAKPGLAARDDLRGEVPSSAAVVLSP